MTEPTCPGKGGKPRRPRLARALVAPCALRSRFWVSTGLRRRERRIKCPPALGHRAQGEHCSALRNSSRLCGGSRLPEGKARHCRLSAPGLCGLTCHRSRGAAGSHLPCCFHSALTLAQTSAALSSPLSQASVRHQTVIPWH